MDTELARTFLEVAATRHFGRAADNLHVTQSAVSARVRQLEELLGCQLFSRERRNIRLTAAGHRLVPHASAILNAWNRARQDVALADASRVLLTVAASALAWEAAGRALLARWVGAMPGTCFAEEVAGPESAAGRVADGAVDLALQFEPPRIPGLLIRPLARVKLVMVSSRPALDLAAALDSGIVAVDWGAEVSRRLARVYAAAPPPRARCRLMESARMLVAELGGVAYLAEEAVRGDLTRGALFRVPAAPEFTRTLYGLYREDPQQSELLSGLLGT